MKSAAINPLLDTTLSPDTEKALRQISAPPTAGSYYCHLRQSIAFYVEYIEGRRDTCKGPLTFGEVYAMMPAELFRLGVAYLFEINKDVETGNTIAQYGDETGKLLLSAVHANPAEAAAKLLISLCSLDGLSLEQ
jgi:hypothetical protein